MTPAEISAEAASRVAAMSGLNVQERRAAKAQIEAQLTAEAEQAEQVKLAEQAQGEAAQERSRIAAVVKLGTNLGRARQAARLALSTQIDASGARALLGTLPQDANATTEALAVPTTVGTFGSPAAVAERRRIASILSCEEATGRFPVAAVLALETTLDAAQAIAALMAAPRQEARVEQSLAERSREAGEFGASFSDNTGMTKSGRVDAMWSRAVKQANASIGAVPSGPTADAVPPNPSISDAERAAMRGAAGLAGAALADLGRV